MSKSHELLELAQIIVVYLSFYNLIGTVRSAPTDDGGFMCVPYGVSVDWDSLSSADFTESFIDQHTDSDNAIFWHNGSKDSLIDILLNSMNLVNPHSDYDFISNLSESINKTYTNQFQLTIDE